MAEGNLRKGPIVRELPARRAERKCQGRAPPPAAAGRLSGGWLAPRPAMARAKGRGLSCLPHAITFATAGGRWSAGPRLDQGHGLAAAPTWSGVYVGAFAGRTWSRDRFTSHNSEGDFPADFTDFNSSGFTGGGLIGANMQMGRWICGTELDIGILNGAGRSRMRMRMRMRMRFWASTILSSRNSTGAVTPGSGSATTEGALCP